MIILSLRYLTIPINIEDEDHDSQSVSLTSPDVSKEIDIVEVEQKTVDEPIVIKIEAPFEPTPTQL